MTGTKKNTKANLFREFNWSESYVSLLLGILVVVLVAVFIVFFVKGRKLGIFNLLKPEISSQKTERLKENASSQKTYTVAQGDDLWSIAEKVYKSGYDWIEIAKANNLTDPNIVHPGNKLIIPPIQPKASAETISSQSLSELTQNAITGVSYTVKKGDDLWEISVRAYGDGYRWVDIAKANNLTNPDLVFEGDNLKIPR